MGFIMRILNDTLNFSQVKLKLNNNKLKKSLLLDYDGTLAPFHVIPSQAKPYPGVVAAIDKIMANPNNRVVIISGRWTADLKRLLNFDKQPEIWGTHGIERITIDGDYYVSKMDERALRGLADADHWLSSFANDIRFEQKPGSLAIHWRGEKEKKIKQIKKRIEPKLRYFSKKSGLSLDEFDGGVELRIPGIHKGSAVETLFTETDKNEFVAYLGDDYTDEYAFEVIKGKGLAILVRKEFRKTQADIWLIPPDELLEFLHEWI
jgi:trehalose 6-phosphate phosphatase